MYPLRTPNKVYLVDITTYSQLGSNQLERTQTMCPVKFKKLKLSLLKLKYLRIYQADFNGNLIKLLRQNVTARDLESTEMKSAHRLFVAIYPNYEQ